MAIDGNFYDVTWGAVRLWCSQISTAGGRTQVIHELANSQEGNHPVQDRGPIPGRPVRCELLFVDMPGESQSALDRLRAFDQQVQDGERLLFTHPIQGSYYVNAGAWDYVIDENGEISSASIEFIRSAETETPIPAGSGTAIGAGADLVAARAADLEALLADLDFGEDAAAIPARAVEAQSSWEDADAVPTRQVILDVAEISGSLNALIEDQGLENDLALWETYKAVIYLGNAIRDAALAALAETPKVTSIKISSPISLLALCVRIYGGAEAEMRVRQILSLNDIRTPAWLPVGSVITIPLPRSRAYLQAA